MLFFAELLDVFSAPIPFDGTVAHKLSGITTKDALPVSRRVVVYDRKTLAYVKSTVSAPDGAFLMQRLPPQLLANPYYVMCFHDQLAVGEEELDNALVYDRIYQVDDLGNPPTE